MLALSFLLSFLFFSCLILWYNEGKGREGLCEMTDHERVYIVWPLLFFSFLFLSFLFLPILKKIKNHRLGNHTSTLPLIHSFTTLSCPCPPFPLPPPPLFLSIPFVPTPPCCLLCSLRCPLSISCLPEFKTRSLCACCWGGAWKRRSTDELRVPRRVSPTPWFRFSLGGWEKKEREEEGNAYVDAYGCGFEILECAGGCLLLLLLLLLLRDWSLGLRLAR